MLRAMLRVEKSQFFIPTKHTNIRLILPHCVHNSNEVETNKAQHSWLALLKGIIILKMVSKCWLVWTWGFSYYNIALLYPYNIVFYILRNVY